MTPGNFFSPTRCHFQSLSPYTPLSHSCSTFGHTVHLVKSLLISTNKRALIWEFPILFSLPPFSDNHISHQHFFSPFFSSASHYVACLSLPDLLACLSNGELAWVWLALPVLSDIELITSSNEGLLLGWTWHLRRVVGGKNKQMKKFH